ncbi:GDP-mannose dehydrogenase [Skermanella stibiiresistens SB22]|uniref:UDP-glucose 6-dehydrogenase n=1 Tax=Skermanella stibiiresistens SB22 TaxID=1385369 RepID=W9H8Y5_9PROT|nr:nucleotide sugar dehydrogenase [Skermanella stibiiresistens]EWY42524.1 GDP-mannose dehydrogenase [Skermanella stibiiresistens SB22]
MKRPVIGFAGLTHLGLVSAAAAAAKGFTVIAHGADAAAVADIRAGNLPVAEPDLDGLFRDHAERLTVTSDLDELGRCDLVYIATDVPTDDEQRSDLTGIEALIGRVIPALAEHAVLVVLCQVPPGFTRGVPMAPERLVYQVETLVFGRAVERASRPERFIIGLADPAAPMPAALASYLGRFDCPVLPMRYESAELAKIAINCCLAASVSVANTLAELSERVGADWAEVVPSLRLDRRIGPHSYLTPGLGLAGGNIERDLATVLDLATRHGTEASTIRGFVTNSLHHQAWAWREFRQTHPEGGKLRVAVLGLAYKENTHSTRNSAALSLIERLRDLEVHAFDPVVPAAMASGAVGARSAMAAAEGADVLFIMTPWPEFARLAPMELARVMKGRTVIDPYRMLDGAAVVAAGLDHHARGLPPRRGLGHP